jgi:tRNA U55 pseudouridine synthase TruB
MKAALSHFAEVHLKGEESRRARHGAAVSPSRAARSLEDGEHVRVLDESGELLAVGVYDAASAKVRPRVMLAEAEK